MAWIPRSRAQSVVTLSLLLLGGVAGAEPRDLAQLDLTSARSGPVMVASNRGPVTFREDDAGQLVSSRGQGGLVWDADGNEYVDLRLGYGPVILGHGDPRVDDYVNERMRKGVSFSLTSEDEIRTILVDTPRRLLTFV